jgi:hypothetical protein
LKNAADIGMTNRKIIVTPCIVKIWLYWSALSNVLSGLASWLRINRASMPPIRKNANALKPYRIPIFLWSTVVNQLHQPVISVGRRITPVRAGTLVAVAISLVLAPTSGYTGRRQGRRSAAR